MEERIAALDILVRDQSSQIHALEEQNKSSGSRQPFKPPEDPQWKPEVDYPKRAPASLPLVPAPLKADCPSSSSEND